MASKFNSSTTAYSTATENTHFSTDTLYIHTTFNNFPVEEYIAMGEKASNYRGQLEVFLAGLKKRKETILRKTGFKDGDELLKAIFTIINPQYSFNILQREFHDGKVSMRNLHNLIKDKVYIDDKDIQVKQANSSSYTIEVDASKNKVIFNTWDTKIAEQLNGMNSELTKFFDSLEKTNNFAMLIDNKTIIVPTTYQTDAKNFINLYDSFSKNIPNMNFRTVNAINKKQVKNAIEAQKYIIDKTLLDKVWFLFDESVVDGICGNGIRKSFNMLFGKLMEVGDSGQHQAKGKYNNIKEIKVTGTGGLKNEKGNKTEKGVKPQDSFITDRIFSILLKAGKSPVEIHSYMKNLEQDALPYLNKGKIKHTRYTYSGKDKLTRVFDQSHMYAFINMYTLGCMKMSYPKDATGYQQPLASGAINMLYEWCVNRFTQHMENIDIIEYNGAPYWYYDFLVGKDGQKGYFAPLLNSDSATNATAYKQLPYINPKFYSQLDHWIHKFVTRKNVVQIYWSKIAFARNSLQTHNSKYNFDKDTTRQKRYHRYNNFKEEYQANPEPGKRMAKTISEIRKLSLDHAMWQVGDVGIRF